MEHKNPMSRVERLHREKVTRYSIRKYSFGAASVAVAALFMFLGNGAVSANELSKQDTPSVEASAPASENKPTSEEATAKPAEAVTPALNKTQLESYISEIETKLSNGSYDNKTEESVAVLKADLESAKATLANATTQAELKKAYSKLVTTANTKLKNKPVEKKETPAVDTTNGKETVGKKAENTEKKSESNSIENTGSKDERNGQALDKNNAFRAETPETQGNFTYSMEYSNSNKKEIYLYNEEDADIDITVNSTAGDITKATVKSGSGQFLLKSKRDAVKAGTKPQPVEEENEIDGFGWTYRQTLTSTKGPVTIKITGKPNDEFKGLSAYKKTEDQNAVLGARYLQLENSNGEKLAAGSNLKAPGGFNLVVKSQTYKYDIQPVAEENKVPVADINSLTAPEITKIKEKIKIQYSDTATREDARLASHKGEVLANRSSVVKNIDVASGTVTVTYNDDSVDTTPVANVARVNAAPTVEIPFSVDGKKDVYVYANEDFDIPIKFKDDNGKVASATITRGGNVEQPPKDALNPNILNNEFNTTVEKISTETVATAETPAIVKIKGNISKDNSGISASLFPKTAEGELKIVTRYATATDTDGAYIKNTATEQAYASDPGSFTIKLKAQTAKYDIKDPETKVTVANANNITEDEFNQIKDSIKIQYSTTNPDKNLLDKQGKAVDNQTDRIESITREGNNVVVTYKDGSKDTKALADFVNVAPTVELPYSNQTNKEIYVYSGENTDLTFKGSDENEVKDLYLRGPGDVKENNANKYGFTTGKVENGVVTGEGSVSEDKRTATIKMTGTTNLTAGKAWTSFIVSKDNDGKLSNTDYRALDVDKNAKEKPGYARFVVKNQTSKYDIASPTEKVAVADPANVTDAELDKIKEKLQIEYSNNNDDANLADKKGKTVDAADAKTKIKSVEKDNAGNLVVTYTDGSTDKKPLSDFVTLDKQPAIEAVEKAAEAQIAAINKTPNATDDEKQAAIDKVNADKEKALTAINDANVTTKDALDKAKESGTTAIAADNPVVAKKDAAKADVEAARKAKEDAIKANPNLTQAEKDAAIAKNNTAAAEATKAIDSATTNDAVDAAKTAGTGEIAKVNPVAKEAAKKAVADELSEKEKAIDARTDLTDAEKAKAKEDAQAKAKAATDAINAQPDNAETPEAAVTAQTAVNDAKDKGVADVKSVNPVAKEAAKKAVADELAEKEKAIDARTDLTDKEKAAAKEDAKAKAKAATDAIDAQPSNAATPEAAAEAQTAVNGAKDKGVADVKSVNPVAKEAAKKAVADELAEKEKAIDARTDLTDAEKAAAKDDAKAKAKAATDAIDAQPSNAATPEAAAEAQTAVNGAKDKGVADVKSVNPVAKEAAKKAVADELAEKEKAIDARTDLTDEEKAAAKDDAKAKAKAATDAIDAQPSNAATPEAAAEAQTAVNGAKDKGVADVKSVDPAAAKKPAAKKAVEDALKAKVDAIDARTDLTDDEKKAAKDAAKDAADKAKEAIDAATDDAALNKAKEAGTGEIAKVNPVAKEAAKKAVADELTKKEAEIAGRNDLTDDEKAKAKEEAQAKAKEATDAIDAQPSNAETPEKAAEAQTAVDGAKDKGVADVTAVNPEAKAKPEAKKAIDDALKAKEAAIDARTDLTDDEKKAAKDAAKDAADKAKEAIDAAPSNAEVDKAKEAGTGEIAKVNPVAKEAAKKAVADELAKKEAEIAGRNDLTDEEKAKAKEEAQAKAKEATDAIDAQPSNAETPEKAAEAQTAVDGAKDKGVADVTAVNPEAKAKPEAKQAIDDALKAKEAAIDARTDLTDDEKKAAKDAAKDAADKAKEAIDAAPSNAEVDKAKEAGTGAVEAINPEAKAKPEAKKAIDDALKAKEAAIDARTDLTDDEKKAAKDAAKDAADKAKEAIDAATDDAALNKAKEAGTGEIAKVNPVAKEAAKKAVADELTKKEAEIAGRNDLTDDEKAKAKEEAQAKAKEATDAIDAQPSNAETPEKAAEAQTAVDGAKDKGVADVTAINPEAKAKPEAKQAIDDALKAKEAAIDARTDLTDDEKKAAKDAAKDAADKAKEAIDAAPSNAEVDKAKEAGTGEIAKVNPVAKEAAKKAVADELTKKEAEIAGRNDLTDEEKAKAKEEAQAKAKEATDAIDAQPSNAETPEKAAEAQTAVDGAKDKGVADVKAVDPEAKAKPAAKKAIEDKLAKQLEDIANTPDATDDEKKVAADAAKALAEGAKKEIDKAGTDAEVKQLQEEAEGEIEKSVPVVEDKPNARKAIEDEAKAKKEAIDARTDLTPKAKEDLKAQVDAIADQAKKSVDAAKTSEAVDGIEESDKAAIKAVGEVNIPADKVLVNNPSALTDDEKAKVLEAVKKVNPDAKEITQDADGNVTVTTPDGHKEIITPEQVVKTAATANDPKAGNDIVKPADKVVVNDPAKLTDAEKEKIKAAVEAVNPNSIVVVDDKGNAKVSTPDGQTQVIPVEELVRTVEDTKKPNAGNDIVKPADKTVVANPEKLTDTEKKAIEDKVKAVNPDATVVVDDKGNVTVTTPEGKTAVIPATDLTKDPEAATKPNAGNDIVKPADKTAVKDPANLTPEEKKAIEDKVKAVNPDATVVVDDKGNATVTTPEGKTAVIPAADLTKDSEAATKPNAGNDIVKPADKTAVKDPANLTKEEKKAIEDKVKAVNPGATVVVDDKGNATVTTPEGKTAVIPATDLTKDPEAATKPNAGNDIVKPADKTAVKDPANLTPEEKKAIEDKVKAVNPDATVVVDDKGNATVTTPEGKTAVIPAADLTKDSEAATKPNAGNDIVKPADKTAVKDPANLTKEEKKAIEDKVKAVNPGATVVVDDKGNATVTTPEGKTAVIPAADLTKDPEAATKPNAGNDIVKPADKTVVANPEKLTDAEKKAIEDKVKAVNPDATVVVDDKGNATVTTPEGKTAVIPAADLTKDPEAATKPNAGNAVNTPAAKVEVKDPAKLTDEEKAKVKKAIEAVNPGSKVVVDDKGNATVTTPEENTAVIPAADVTKSAANAGNAVNTPAAKVEVKDPANLTDAEKKAIEDKVKAVNPGSKVVVDDKGNATVTTPEGKTATIPATDLTKSASDAGKANAGNGANTPATKTVVKDPANLTDEEKAKVKKAVEDVNPGSTVVVNDKGDVIVTKGDGTVLVIPELDLVIPEDKLTDPTQQNGVNTPATRVLVGDKAKLTADEIEKVKESIKAVNPGSTVVVDENGNATVTTPEGKTATIPAAQLVKDAKDVAAKNNGENINVDFEKETVADFNNLTDAEKEAAKAKIKGANADVLEVIFDKAGNATVITKDGKVYTIVAKDIFKQRPSADNGSSANAGQTASAQANARKVAQELPNTGTADSTVAMVAAAASALLGLGLAGRRRKEDEEA